VHRAAPRGSESGPFSGPNLPFTLLVIVCGAALTWFMMTSNPFKSETAAGPTTSTAPETNGDNPTTLPTDTSQVTQPTIPDGTGTLQGITLERIATTSFPVYATGLEGDDRIWILDRGGVIWTAAPDGTSEVFMDLQDRVNAAGIENGLLGLAFHPDFASNGRLFVYYTTDPSTSPHSRLSEFTISPPSAATGDGSTERVLLDVTQEGVRHRAGMLQFGPDGYLYVALGDGGLGDRTAQDLTKLQGSILRLDVDRSEGGKNYAIPPDNPFVAGGGLPEIWFYGLRNPWRFAFDTVSNLMYVADVGQLDWEEINAVTIGEGGLDFGWPNFEGPMCYTPSDGCDMDRGVIPIHLVEHTDEQGGCSLSGGPVYRGPAMPELWGHYFYGDWCYGWVRSFKYENGEVTDHRDWTADIDASLTELDRDLLHIGSFGLDADGELLLVDTDGLTFRIVPRR
jgi:glucose/arabinose dehydrogenase